MTYTWRERNDGADGAVNVAKVVSGMKLWGNTRRNVRLKKKNYLQTLTEDDNKGDIRSIVGL